jgi:hypothetical protein
VRPRLAREAAERRRRLRLRRLAVAVEQRRLGEHQPGLGGLGRHPAGGELGNRPLGRGACLGDQPHREEQLAAVAEAVHHRDAVAPPPVLRSVVPVERGRHVAAPGGNPAEVVLDVRKGHVELERRVELGGGDQVGFGGGQRAALGVDQAAVVQRAGFPETIAGAPERAERRAVPGECFLEPMVVMEQRRALELEPGCGDAAQRRVGELELSERAA